MVEGSSALISFSKLLSFDTTEVELVVDGHHINVAAALDASGVRLVASYPDRDQDLPDSQLDLFDRSALR